MQAPAPELVRRREAACARLEREFFDIAVAYSFEVDFFKSSSVTSEFLRWKLFDHWLRGLINKEYGIFSLYGGLTDLEDDFGKFLDAIEELGPLIWRILCHGIFIMSSDLVIRDSRQERINTQSIEERNFQAALIMIEAHFTRQPPIGRKTFNKALETVRRTMDKTLNKPDIREVLAKNVDIWMRLQIVFLHAIPDLGVRSLSEAATDPANHHADVQECSALIAENYPSLLEDLTLLNNLLVIARNMLAIKVVGQDICSTVKLDEQVNHLIILCVNVTSKGYDGENVDNITRSKLNEITELYKKLLVTSLQFLHNLTMGNDFLKMTFWYEMLFDGDLHNDTIHELPPDGLRVDVVYQEVRHWLTRNRNKSPMAQAILEKHKENVALGHTAGPLPPDYYQEVQEGLASVTKDCDPASGPHANGTQPVWSDRAPTKYGQDLMYGRVSHEIDVWWKRVRDPNYDNWLVPMETVEGAKARARTCKENAMTRYIPRVEQDADLEFDHQGHYDEAAHGDVHYRHNDQDARSLMVEDGEDVEEEEEEEEDDDSYVEGPLRGLLTEIPNILDTKQIEALHMTVKACIVDSMGSGLTKAGENLQKTRCKMFLALDCGKNLLREMLVFIAVWEQSESQFIFQITAQIIESFHHNALLPYAWNSLRILKDIVSPAQTVLLRLINYMFRARKLSTIYSDDKDYTRDAKLIHFLYNYFRCRVVPDCIALIYAQAQIRNKQAHPQDFPVDLWDMERAKDGLAQYLDFLVVIADIPEMRPLLIEWECTYELFALLDALEAGVPRKPLVDPIRPTAPKTEPSPASDTTISDEDGEGQATNGGPQAIERPYDPNPPHVPSHIDMTDNDTGPGLPPLHDTPHKFPWTGIKNTILQVLASLVQPQSGKIGPGNPVVQKQVMKHGGMMALLNCCVYDGHNEYLKERATLALKWVMEGCDEAQNFVRELSPLKNQTQTPQQAAQAPAETKANSQVAPSMSESQNEAPTPVEPAVEVRTGGADSGSGSGSATESNTADATAAMEDLKIDQTS